MSVADKLFIKNCREIIDNGFDTTGLSVRTVWEDGVTPAHTKKIFGVVDEYNLAEEFPAMTLRRMPIVAGADEIDWIYKKKSNRLEDLNSKVWDLWAKEDGTIGTCYGDIISRKFKFNGEDFDQMDRVLWQLKNDPYSRRIMTNLWQTEYLETGSLEPCCYSTTWVVTHDTEGNKVLNLILNQRSQDMLAANGWNTCQYAVMQLLLAHINGMKPGKLKHVIADCHIYDRHIPIVEELIKLPNYDAPKVYINPELKDFYDFKPSDVIVEDYKYNPFKAKIELAI